MKCNQHLHPIDEVKVWLQLMQQWLSWKRSIPTGVANLVLF